MELLFNHGDVLKYNNGTILYLFDKFKSKLITENNQVFDTPKHNDIHCECIADSETSFRFIRKVEKLQ